MSEPAVISTDIISALRNARAQPYTAADLAKAEQIVKELHGLSGFDLWAQRIAQALAAERDAERI